jgi:hypothetical protein
MTFLSQKGKRCSVWFYGILQTVIYKQLKKQTWKYNWRGEKSSGWLGIVCYDKSVRKESPVYIRFFHIWIVKKFTALTIFFIIMKFAL